MCVLFHPLMRDMCGIFIYLYSCFFESRGSKREYINLFLFITRIESNAMQCNERNQLETHTVMREFKGKHKTSLHDDGDQLPCKLQTVEQIAMLVLYFLLQTQNWQVYASFIIMRWSSSKDSKSYEVHEAEGDIFFSSFFLLLLFNHFFLQLFKGSQS